MLVGKSILYWAGCDWKWKNGPKFFTALQLFSKRLQKRDKGFKVI